MKYLLGLCLLLVLPLSLSAAERMTAAQINKIVFKDRADKTSFEFEGVAVTGRSHPIEESLSLTAMDDTGAILLILSNSCSNEMIRAGDRIHVQGSTSFASSLSGSVHVNSIKRLGSGPAPQPVDITAADFFSGRYFNRLVRIKGHVRNAGTDEIDPNFALVEIRSDGEPIFASARITQKSMRDIERLNGALVAATGFCMPRMMTNRPHIGPMLILKHGLSDIEVLQTAPTDPSDLPDVSTLKHLRPSEIVRKGWHTAQGQLLCTWNAGHDALIRRPGSPSLRVSFTEPCLMPTRTDVTVFGLPDPNLFTVDLVQAHWQQLPKTRHAPIATNDVTAANLFTDGHGRDQLHPEYHGFLLRITGIVSELKVSTETERQFLLECDSYPIAILLGDAFTSAIPPAGSVVSILGFCLVESGSWHPKVRTPRIPDLAIVLPDDSSLTLISQPPWWTPFKFMLVSGLLLALLLAIIIWNRSLHVLATRRGHQLFREKVAHYEANLRVDERTKLAVELHDSLAQSLSGAFMELETAERLGSDASPDMLKHLQIAAATVKSCHGELRNCLWDLRNTSLDEPNLETAIRKTLAPHVRGIDIAVRFNVPRTRLSDNTAHNILRIIRELVLNAIRHGKATAIQIAGCINDGKLLFSVRDNGCGFDPDDYPGILQGHFGLEGIRERAGLLAGNLELESAHGNGTKATVTIVLPITDTKEQT